MELTRKEEYRNQKVSIGVTIFSFIVMVLFFIYTNIITANASPTRTGIPEVTLAMEDENGTGQAREQKTALATGKQENASDKKEIAAQGEEPVPVKENNAKENTVTPQAPEKNDLDSSTGTPAGFKGTSLEPAGLGFELAERSIVRAPDFTNTTQEEGKVIVDIVVNKNGEVIEADPNGRGTTTTSTRLKAEARKLALATTFNQNYKREEQRGTITIIFTFN